MVRQLFCSEKMELCQVLLHEENAYNCLVELGHNGGLQFNNIYDEDRMLNGLYTKKVHLCYELVRIVDYLLSQMKSLDITPTFYEHVDTEDRPQETDLPIYEVHLRHAYGEVHAVMEHYNTLEKRKNYLIEKRFALLRAHQFLTSDGVHGPELLYSESVVIQLIRDQSAADPASSQLNYILGSINVSRFPAFELMLYRLFGRNLLIRRAEMPTKMVEQVGSNKELVTKFVVLLMTTSTSIRPKLLKTCHAFHVTIFECPESPSQRMLMVNQVENDINDLDIIQNETRDVRKLILYAAAREIYIVRINLNKSLKVYDILNRLNPVAGQEHLRYLQGECFVPASEIDGVRAALNRGSNKLEKDEILSYPAILLKRDRKFKHMPPTYFRLNKFTQGFQNLIDSYGMADYRELNPAPYTVVTFPFLFAIMFGDLGHGLILTLFACVLIYKEKSVEEINRTAEKENEILNILFAGRYIILLMGIFSIYVGMIYNDVLSIAVNVFGSSWSSVYNETTAKKVRTYLTLDPNDEKFYSGHPYPFGVDPIWKISGEDSITTFNSLKMKLAIILGVCQMMFGLTLSAINCINLDRKSDLILVVIPQCVFMICLFCYLVFLIFFKWLNYGGLKQSPYNSACAPSVLITFIDMMLMKTSEIDIKECNKGMFANERTIEYILVLIAFIAVPILLAGKPLYITQRQHRLKKKRKERDLSELQQKGRDTMQMLKSSVRYSEEMSYDKEPQRNNTIPESKDSIEDDMEYDMTEIWIHSGIHTIESVLGSVSHTASYLRLWALSLAHSQLADVLWHMVLSKGLHNQLNIFLAVPVLAVSFCIWAILTVAILVMMEGLSAFLHTLRLHWVEFQSKFFSGAGEAFRPFYFPPSTIRG